MYFKNEIQIIFTIIQRSFENRTHSHPIFKYICLKNYARQLNQYKNNWQKQQQLTIYIVKPYNRSEMAKQLLT